MDRRQKVTMGLAGLLPAAAWTIFMVMSPPMTSTVMAAPCETGICLKNGCTEGAQYCLPGGVSFPVKLTVAG